MDGIFLKKIDKSQGVNKLIISNGVCWENKGGGEEVNKHALKTSLLHCGYCWYCSVQARNSSQLFYKHDTHSAVIGQHVGWTDGIGRGCYTKTSQPMCSHVELVAPKLLSSNFLNAVTQRNLCGVTTHRQMPRNK